MGDSDRKLTRASTDTEVNAFLRKVASTPAVRPGGEGGRLIFALDATASREPTWDRAAHIQAEMFRETAALGGLQVQLCHYGGFEEFDASPWYRDTDALARRMTAVRCRAGHTQIERVIRHGAAETRRARVQALVFVGDCMEEMPERLYRAAGELSLLGLPMFLFHEGGDPVAERVFRRLAELTGGACCPFDAGSAGQLRDLLGAVAVFAAGGRTALEDFSRRRGGTVPALTHQLGRR